ncbi:MAG: acyl-CoA thioesterase [Myxococcaceae bacterium]|nr:acyl-CoA thioesterase [Myxococcaceae bacterium]MBH2006165.1 acyl-CoA thioesterase [Myxococcaceae bacterium]
MSVRLEKYVRFADVDAAGWLYYPRFIEYCQESFEDWVNASAPLNYRQIIDEQRWGFPAVQVQGKYRSPLKHADRIWVDIQILHLGTSSMRTGFQFIRQDNDALSFEAEITSVCTNLDQAKSMPIPEVIREFLESIRL